MHSDDTTPLFGIAATKDCVELQLMACLLTHLLLWFQGTNISQIVASSSDIYYWDRSIDKR